MKLFWYFLPLVIVSCDQSSSAASLWNNVLKMDHVITSVEHHGKTLHVWKEDKENYTMYYVNPLLELIHNSIRCIHDDYSDSERYIYRFSIRLWDKNITLKVKNALTQNGYDSLTMNILPLPMQYVRILMDDKVTKKIEVHNRWRSNQNQPFALDFELFMKEKDLCHKMVNDSKENTRDFLANFKLELEFMIVSGSTESRNLNITGRSLQHSNFFSSLSNEVNPDGDIYLTSNDANNLARDIYQSVGAYEEVTSGYIPSEQEDRIISELLGKISQQEVNSLKLEGNEWDSVFWDDIFTRPDIQTEYLNEVFKYNDSTSQFVYDSHKENEYRSNILNQYSHKVSKSANGGGSFSIGPFSLGGNGGSSNIVEKGGLDINNTATHEINTLAKNDLVKGLEQSHVNSRWSGTKFEQKSMKLHRLNTHKLSSSSQLYYKRVTVTKLSLNSELEIVPEPFQAEYEQDYDSLKRSEDFFNQRLTNLEAQYQSLNKKHEEASNLHISNLGELQSRVESLHNEQQNQIQNLQTDQVNIQHGLQGQINEKSDHLQNQFNELSRLRQETHDHFSNIVYNDMKPKLDRADYLVRLHECKRLIEGGQDWVYSQEWKDMSCNIHCAYFTSYLKGRHCQ